MKKIPLCLSIFSLLEGTTWTPQTPITEAATAADFVSLAYDPYKQQVFSAWSYQEESSGDTFYYSSIYNNLNWSNPYQINPIAENYGSSLDVFLAYYPPSEEMFSAFGIFLTNRDAAQAVYAPFNGTSWTGGTISDNQQDGSANIYLTYNGGQNTLFATFALSESGGTSFYGIYSSSGGWSTGEIVEPEISQALNSVYSAYNSDYNNGHGGLFAGWVDNVTNYPTVYIYDNASSSWIEPPTTISVIAETAADNNVNLAYNTTTGETYAAWTAGGVPQFSILPNGGTSWITTQIPGAPTAQLDVFLLYVSEGNQTFASWVANNQASQPYYAIYSDGSWTTQATPITTTGAYPKDANYNVILTYNPSTNQVFAAWEPSFSEPYYPYYSTFQIGSVVVVSSFTGYQKLNDFGMVSELYNTLNWTPPQGVVPTGYNLFRNGQFLATLPYTQLTYQDHNRKKGVADTYSLTPLQVGGEGVTVSITVGGL